MFDFYGDVGEFLGVEKSMNVLLCFEDRLFVAFFCYDEVSRKNVLFAIEGPDMGMMR